MRAARLIAANEALYAPGHVAIEAQERERGMDELYAIAEQESRRVVQRQIDLGLDVVSDGEFRRYAFFGHLIDAVDGFDKMGGWAIPFRNEAGEELVFKRPVVVDGTRTLVGFKPEAYAAAFPGKR